MKYGAVFPQTEYGSDPASVRDYAQTVEGLGFNHVVAYDHILGANPDRPGGWRGTYTYQAAFLEPFVLFSYMAGVTQKLGFLTGIIILPQRQTALVAKQAATLDVLTGGKFRLGVGLGWNEVEYTSLNEDFHNRGKRIEEQVEVLRQLWTQPLVTIQGEWHHIPDAGLNPLPVQRPIPIWFGGQAEPVLRRTAKLGDGWLPNTRTPEDSRPALEMLIKFLKEAGRSLEQFGIEARIPYGSGDPDTWRKLVQGWQEMGAGLVSINTMGSGFNTPKEHLAALEKFAEAVGVG